MNLGTGNAAGAFWMSLSMAGFVLNDTLMKSLAGEIPLFQAIFLRGLCASALVAMWAWHRGALRHRPAGRDRPLVLWRVVGEIGATSLFLTALFNMPIANATAILQATPLVVALAAAWFLGAEIGWRRYSAIGVGFLGVLLIVRPGTEGFNAFSLSALAAVIFLVIRDLSTRCFSAAMPSLLITVITSLAITVFSGVVAAFGDWVAVDLNAALCLGGAAVLLLVGYYAGILAMRVGEIGFVQPFRYSNLLWAILLGFLVFGETPAPLTWLGVAIVTGTGLYTLHRERVRR